MSDKPKKKSLWELLNTPVKDLVKTSPEAPKANAVDAGPASNQVAAPATVQPEPAAIAATETQAKPVAETPKPAPELIQEAVSTSASQPLADKLAADKLAAEKLAAEKLAADKLAADKLAGEKLAAEKLAADKLAGEKLAADKLATEKLAAEKLASEKLAAEKLAAEKVAAEKLAAEKLAAEKVAAEKLAAEKATLSESSQPAETLEDAKPEAVSATSEAKPRKKSLWELLNTPVQDLFKEGQVIAAESEDSDVAFLGLGRDKPVLEGSEKQSWLAHFRSRLARTRTQFAESITRLAKGRTKVDEDMLEELEEILLQSDMGVKTTDDVLEFLRGEAKKRRFLPEEVLPALTGFLEKTLQSEPFRVEAGRLNIFLIVGVNGTGKTTTVGKVAAKLKIGGYKVMLAAGDTFRAAAIDQLAIWGQRCGCPVIQHHEGADAAAVVYDAIQSARAKKVDVLLIDTAGRLHNKDHLMEELRKIHRIIEREKQDARVENVLVLDATTGQNGLRQAEVFSKSVPLNSLILTKLDGTAKGGVIFGIKRELGIPIKLLGVGEHLGDLQEFDPKSFVQALFAQEEGSEAAELASKT